MLAFPCCPDSEDINTSEVPLPFVERQALLLMRRDEPAGFYPETMGKCGEVLVLNVAREREAVPSLIGRSTKQLSEKQKAVAQPLQHNTLQWNLIAARRQGGGEGGVKNKSFCVIMVNFISTMTPV